MSASLHLQASRAGRQPSWLQTVLGRGMLIALLLAPGAGLAQTSLYWDINSTTAGAGGTTPTGGWRTNSASYQNWNTVANGTGTTGVWTAGNIAVFSAGTDATGNYTVTVNNVSADSIVIQEGNITFSSSTITLTGTTPSVTVASGRTATFGSKISGTDFVKAGAGTVVFNGTAKNYTGTTYVNTGTLRLGASNMIGNASDIIVASGATFDLAGYADTVGSLGGAGNITLGAGTLTTDGDGDTTEFSGIISGTGALAKTGTDTLVLSGANTYAGATTVTAGALNIRHSSALGSTAGGTTVSSGRELQLEGNISVGAEALSITGTGISSAGALRNISGTNTYGGLITLTGNTQFTADAGALTLSGGVTGANRTLTLTGDGDFTIGAMALGSGTLTKRNTGTLTLSGSNTSTGATVIGTAGSAATGTVQLTADNALANGALTLYAGTLDLNGHDDTIGALNLGGGEAGSTATVTTGAGTLTLGGNLTYSATNNAGGATISGHLDLGGANRTLNIGDSSAVADDVTINAIISGSAGLIKGTSTGTLVLSGANTYTGLTQVTAGILNIRHSSALGSTAAGTVVTSGDQLQVQGGLSIGAEALSLTGTGVGSTGALRNISGDNSWAGLVTLTGNTQLQSDAGNLTLSGGVTGSNRTLTITGDGNITISGALTTGTGGLIKRDTGTLLLSGANTNTGTTTIGLSNGAAGGTLRSGASHVLSDGTLTLYAGTLDLNGHDDTVGTLNLGGGEAGSTATITTGAGTLTLGGNLTYSATNNASGATISGHLDLGGTNRTLNIGDSSAVDPDVTVSAIISGSAGLIKSGSGTLVLSGASTYTGTTTVSGGILNLRNSSALGSTAGGTTVTSGNELQLEGGISVGAEALSITGTGISSAGALRNISGTNTYGGLITLTGSTQFTTDAGNLTLSGGVTGTNRALTLAGAGNITIAGITTGNGSLDKNGSGTATLTAASTYAGNTNINAGTLALAGSGYLATATAVTVAAGATFDLAGHSATIATLAGAGNVDLGGGSLTTAGNGSTTFSGTLTGAGTFTKEGTGTLTLDNSLTFDGTFNLAGGTLQLSAITLGLTTLNITADSFLDFGGASTLNVTNFTISAGVTLTIQNWANTADYFFAQNWTGAVFNSTGTNPMNQVVFTGFPANDTIWLGYENNAGSGYHQITPVPEPSTYGALLLFFSSAAIILRRRQRRSP